MKIKVKVQVDIDNVTHVIDGSYGYIGSIEGLADQVCADVKGKLSVLGSRPAFKKLDDVVVKKGKVDKELEDGISEKRD